MSISEPQQLRHVLVLEDDQGPRLVCLGASSHSIGRDASNSLVLKAKDVSRQHAILLRVSGREPETYGFMLIDGDLQGKRSRNGILVNSQRWSAPHRLQHGDFIRFAKQVVCRYLVLPAQSDQDFQQFCSSLNLAQVLSEGDSLDLSSFDNVVFDDSDETNDAFLIRLASFPEINPSPMFEVNLNGELTYLNPAAAEAFTELSQQGVKHPTLDGLFALVKSSPSKILVREIAVQNRVFEQSIHFLPESELIRCCAFDITERKHAESELMKRDRLLQSVAEATTHLLENVACEAAIDEAIAKLGFASGADRICISANHSPSSEDELQTSLQFEWVRDPKLSLLKAAHRYDQSFSTSPLQHWYLALSQDRSVRGCLQSFSAAEQTMLTRENVQSILVVPIVIEKRFWGFIELHHCELGAQWTDQDESIVFAMAASISAALQRQQSEQIIHHQAFHDPLTNLPNRILFEEQLVMALEEAEHSKLHVCVMFIDLDRFKRINDTLGHTVGDQLLCTIAQRLPDCLPEESCLARWGGDEFTLLLPQVDSEQEAIDVADRILESIKRPFSIASQTLFVGASIGIACSPEAGTTAEMLLQNADVALYRCKDQMSSGYQLYDPTMNAKAPELFMIENSFHDGLKRNEFVLYYQPKFNIVTNEIVGLEALIRWQHPTMGLVPPGLFIPIAEETGFIAEIGSWVLETACEQVVDWHGQGFNPLSVSVNLSAQQFYQPTLLSELSNVLQSAKIPPQFLELEITETTAVANIELTTKLLQQVQDIGIRIAMDDFGTGYSSLNYLKKLPLDTLKIDQSFIRDLSSDTKDIEIVRAVISLALGLELDIVAEGVDKEEQIGILKALNCNIVQGYYFSHPLTAEQMTQMLQQNWAQRDLNSDEPFLSEISKLSLQQFP